MSKYTSAARRRVRSDYIPDSSQYWDNKANTRFSTKKMYNQPNSESYEDSYTKTSKKALKAKNNSPNFRYRYGGKNPIPMPGINTWTRKNKILRGDTKPVETFYKNRIFKLDNYRHRKDPRWRLQGPKPKKWGEGIKT